MPSAGTVTDPGDGQLAPVRRKWPSAEDGLLPKMEDVEPLGSHHDRAAFSCSEAAQVFVALGGSPPALAGYYSLSAASFQRADLPPELERRLPHYPVPAARLGRLAVDRSWQGRKLGTFLLLDAVHRVLRASAAMAVYAILVEAKGDDAARFYQRFGFQPFPGTPGRLFMPLDVFVKAGL